MVTIAKEDIAAINENLKKFMVQKEVSTTRKENADLLKAYGKTITPCNGEYPDETRIWVDELEVALDSLSKVKGSPAYMAKSLSRGMMHKEIADFVRNKDDTLWKDIKKLVRDNFISKNEEEKLRCKLDEIYQEADESIMTFNRRFSQLANKAYPTTGELSERALIKLYIPSLANRSLARKLTLSEKNKSLKEAMTYAEGQEASLELFDSYISSGGRKPANKLQHDNRAIEPMEVNKFDRNCGNYNAETAAITKSIEDLKECQEKMQDKMSSRMGKLEAKISFHQ